MGGKNKTQHINILTQTIPQDQRDQVQEEVKPFLQGYVQQHGTLVDTMSLVHDFVLHLQKLDEYWLDADLDDLHVNEKTTRVLYDTVKHHAKGFKYPHHDEKVVEQQEAPKDPPNIPLDEGKNTRASKVQKPQKEEESNQILENQPSQRESNPPNSNQSVSASKRSKRISKNKAPSHRPPHFQKHAELMLKIQDCFNQVSDG